MGGSGRQSLLPRSPEISAATLDVRPFRAAGQQCLKPLAPGSRPPAARGELLSRQGTAGVSPRDPRALRRAALATRKGIAAPSGRHLRAIARAIDFAVEPTAAHRREVTAGSAQGTTVPRAWARGQHPTTPLPCSKSSRRPPREHRQALARSRASHRRGHGQPAGPGVDFRARWQRRARERARPPPRAGAGAPSGGLRNALTLEKTATAVAVLMNEVAVLMNGSR